MRSFLAFLAAFVFSNHAYSSEIEKFEETEESRSLKRSKDNDGGVTHMKEEGGSQELKKDREHDLHLSLDIRKSPQIFILAPETVEELSASVVTLTGADENTLAVLDYDETIVMNVLTGALPDGYEVDIGYIYTNEFQRDHMRQLHTFFEAVKAETFGEHFKLFRSVKGIQKVTQALIEFGNGKLVYAHRLLSPYWEVVIQKLKEKGAAVIVGSGKGMNVSHMLEVNIGVKKGLEKWSLMEKIGIGSGQKTATTFYQHLQGVKMEALTGVLKGFMFGFSLKRNLVESPFDKVIHIDNNIGGLKTSAAWVRENVDNKFTSLKSGFKYSPFYLQQFDLDFKKNFMPELQKLRAAYEHMLILQNK